MQVAFVQLRVRLRGRLRLFAPGAIWTAAFVSELRDSPIVQRGALALAEIAVLEVLRASWEEIAATIGLLACLPQGRRPEQRLGARIHGRGGE